MRQAVSLGGIRLQIVAQRPAPAPADPLSSLQSLSDYMFQVANLLRDSRHNDAAGRVFYSAMGYTWPATECLEDKCQTLRASLASSLASLASFSHSRCDALLQHRGIVIPGAYDPVKFPSNSVYLGLWLVLAWETLVVTITIVAWRRTRAPEKQTRSERTWSGWRYAGPIFILLGLVALYSQLFWMAKYSDICRQLLSVAPH